jgi:hypothetical protein
MSVQRKALTSADLLSPDWFRAAITISAEFGKSILGKSAYWYTYNTAFPAIGIPFVIGGIVLLMRKSASAIPLLLITVAYVAAFTGSGSAYTRNFPWYFAPVLPATYLICGVGVTWMLSLILKKLSPFHKKVKTGALYAIAVLCWFSVSIVPLHHDAITLSTGWKNYRERVYASAAVWAGKHVGHDVVVAANEIGAIGFFLPRKGSMIDMFGLLSRKDTLGVSYVKQIREKLPHCIFTRAHFPYKKKIEEQMRGSYQWYYYRTLDVGIRSDLASSLERFLPDFRLIYETLDIDKEYDWDSVLVEALQKQDWLGPTPDHPY